MNFDFIEIDLNNQEHCRQLLYLLDVYMQDEMGNGVSMANELAPRIINGLKNYSGYLGFFALADNQYVALANCNKNFSTFKTQPLINIHDFIVLPDYRGKGVGKYLLDSIASFGIENGYCRVNLEVRYDNLNALKLYKKAGFTECHPPMYFLERQL